jgi:glycine hydroxymethyltransferase
MLQNSDLAQLVAAEELRQLQGLELIPSENYVSKDVREALSSVFTNKYSEGYPGKRYYGGQINTDQVELIAIEKAKQLFRADHANVQPHSGAQANAALYHAWLEPGDTVLAMDLSHGGHLTHGHPVTVLASEFNFVRYKMKNVETGEIDFDEIARLADEHKPKMLLVGYSSYPRELDYAKFAEIGNRVGAVLAADVAHIAGLIAGGVLANPLDFGFHVLTSTTHKTLRGPRGGLIVSKGVVSNPLQKPPKTIENLPTLIDRTVFPGLQGGPHMNTILAKAVSFDEALKPGFKVYAQQVVANAKELADQLSAKGMHLVTGGTDNHLLLIDVKKSLDIDGAVAEAALDAVGLNANKNVVPDDTLPPFTPSGLRLGTPALTTRGVGTEHMQQLAEWIVAAMQSHDDSVKLADIKRQVVTFAEKFPLP